MHASAWLRGGRADGGLVIPGRHWRGRAATLRLASDAAWLSHAGEALRLDWDDYARPLSGWHPCNWATGKSAIGAALCLRGRYVPEARAMRHRMTGMWDVLVRLFEPGWAVPLYHVGTLRRHVSADLFALNELCQRLRDEPELRPRLDDAARVDALLRDLASTPHEPVWARRGIRPRTRSIEEHLERVGYTHGVLGRPMPDARVAPIDEVTNRVWISLQMDGNQRERRITQPQIGAIARRRYTDVRPWPFAAVLSA